MNETNTELYEKLARFQWLLHKQQLRSHSECGPMGDPMRGQGRILALLKMQDGVSAKDLSYLLGIRVSSLNEMLAKLEKNDYVTREPSQADKRVILVKLTEKGRSEPRESRPDPAHIFSSLSPQEQKAFGDALDKVIAVPEDELGDDKDEEDRAWWMRGARERMGDEMFERLASMRRDGFDPRRGFGGFPHGGPFGRGGMRPDRPMPGEDPDDQDKEMG